MWIADNPFYMLGDKIAVVGPPMQYCGLVSALDQTIHDMRAGRAGPAYDERFNE